MVRSSFRSSDSRQFFTACKKTLPHGGPAGVLANLMIWFCPNNSLDALNASFGKQIADLRTELKDLIGQERSQQNTALQLAQRELNDRLDFQQKENTENLQVVQRSLSDRLDKLAADTNQQMQHIQRDLSDRLNQINTEQTERARNNQIEARQRVDNLRAELNQFNSLLSGQKVSRDELGVLLLELSHRLQKET